MNKCPKCGRFLKDVSCVINGMDEIISVDGICSKHHKVEPTDWAYEDFFPFPKAPEPNDSQKTSRDNE